MKKIVTLLLATVMVLSLGANTFGATAGWQQDYNGWWYQNADGSYPYSAWQLIDDSWYHFGDNGYMQTGWLLDGGSWYYLASSGRMVVGWLNDNGTWYYLSSSGRMTTGWLYDGGYWYYLSESGAMLTGTQVINGVTYYFNSNGTWNDGSASVPNGVVVGEASWRSVNLPNSVRLWPFITSWSKVGFTIDLPTGQEKYHKVGTFKFINSNGTVALDNADAYYCVENQTIIYAGLSTSSISTFNSASFKEACILLLQSYNTNLTYARAAEIVDYCLNNVEYCTVDNYMRIHVIKRSARDYYAFHIEY